MRQGKGKGNIKRRLAIASVVGSAPPPPQPTQPKTNPAAGRAVAGTFVPPLVTAVPTSTTSGPSAPRRTRGRGQSATPARGCTTYHRGAAHTD